ncbi:hypothetical protein BJX68DRAFT_146933 [Aspergillus pseudodeflectus]|uniref:Myb-like domain-containing protein n=1 Tax=Aspergillus pseudodeflectus TaxID=176178 RepID=A0ABR4JX76_9EURO
MKSFSSSVINKSGKKFAPKAPVRRAAPAPPPRVPSRRASVASQASASHPPGPASETATPEPPPPSTSTVEPPTSSQSAIPPPTSTAASIEQGPNDQRATAIPIPVPKRKASFSVPITLPTKDVSASSHSPPPTSIAAPEQQSDRIAETSEVVFEAAQTGEGHEIRSVATHNEEVAPEVRPAKRPKATVESVPTIGLDQPPEEAIQLATPPATQPPALVARSESRDESESQPAARRRSSTAKSDGRALGKTSTSNDTGAAPKKPKRRRMRKREPTPEGAELIQIAPSVVKMSDLCKDTRTGKRSKRETELRAHELAEAERRKAQQEEGAAPDQTPVKQIPTEASPTAEVNQTQGNQASQVGPVMRIVNGEIVLDHASLQVDRHADAERNGGDLEDVIENSLTRKINQATYGKRSKTESWDEDMTDLFYRGLRMFGTDFMVISKMFPGRSRRQIKLKFNNEERRDPQRIKETLLGPRETIDIQTYSEMTNTVYDDPRVIQQELDEEKKRIEEQHETDKKAQEDLLRNPDGLEGSNANGTDKTATKSKRNNKKQARDLGGGTEEILGSLDD